MSSTPTEAPGRFQAIMQKVWWLHSFGALLFGVFVMLFARKGLAYADKVLVVLLVSWLLMFVALRFIVGPANRKDDEWVARKGVRVVTNYIIKQLYQQMFFFLVPLYAASTTWMLESWNWWIAPLLLIFAIISTMDLVFDNVIMERRKLAAAMYGLAMFGVLNVMLPLVFEVTHFSGLLVAATATPICVALLSFSLKQVFSPVGMGLLLLCTGATLALAWFGKHTIPPAPLSMLDGSVGHGTYSSYECTPPQKSVISSAQLVGLRCGSILTEPGGIKSNIVHVWSLDGKVVQQIEPLIVSGCEKEGVVHRSMLAISLAEEGKWQCEVRTTQGQLIGSIPFSVIE